MEPQSPVPNSGAENTVFSTPKHIVEVHSPLTAKMLPKKFDALNQPRPVLHKYSAEQVEVIYHRRTGDEVVSKPTKVPSELVKTTPKRNSKKKISISAPNSASTDVSNQITNGKSNGNSAVIPLDLNHTTIQETSSLNVENCSRKIIPDEASDAVQHPPVINSNSSQTILNSMDVENESLVEASNSHEMINTDCANSFLLNRVNELTQLVSKIIVDMSEMQSKLQKLENDNLEMVRNNHILRQEYMNHIRTNSLVALEMKRLKNLVNKSETFKTEQDVDALLTRAKFSRVGKENGMCSMKRSSGTTIKPGSLSSCKSDIKEIQGDASS
ncbi:unnamed protein product [Allacma fusca]|uniref:Uncharacterized protein n=1 Tax=Allacma fusca TaxID=39272 RepID=A0A8J2KBX5_9HEXA|nr:unnamed protein product [Allacma fusca]